MKIYTKFKSKEHADKQKRRTNGLREKWDIMKHTNIPEMEVPEREKREK